MRCYAAVFTGAVTVFAPQALAQLCPFEENCQPFGTVNGFNSTIDQYRAVEDFTPARAPKTTPSPV